MEVTVPVKRRDLYLISGKSRLDWMHGIKAEHVHGRRMVATIRELAPGFLGTELGDKLSAIAKNFI